MMVADSKNYQLSQLLSGLLADQVVSDDVKVSSITLDSRTVLTGSLFLLLAKDPAQRLQFLNQAVSLGAIAVLLDSEDLLSAGEREICAQNKVSSYAIDSLADNAGEIAAKFYGRPSEKLTIMAITGTNGKTSVSQFIAQALEFLG